MITGQGLREIVVLGWTLNMTEYGKQQEEEFYNYKLEYFQWEGGWEIQYTTPQGHTVCSEGDSKQEALQDLLEYMDEIAGAHRALHTAGYYEDNK